MVSLAGLEPATFCLEDRRSDSTELQAPKPCPKSNVQDPKSVLPDGHRAFQMGLWTFTGKLNPNVESRTRKTYFGLWTNWVDGARGRVGLFELHAPASHRWQDESRPDNLRVQCPMSRSIFRVLTLDFGPWTLDFGLDLLVPEEGLKPSTSGL
jgi:hypothetical protein